jgi:two-component system, OmpR family, sensor kinase
MVPAARQPRQHDDNSFMFRRRLTLALGLLATASVLQGAAALWALKVADEHALHGRVTNDIHLDFVELSATKQRLRTWVSQTLLGAGADAAERLRLQGELTIKISHLKALSRQAIALGTGLTQDDRQIQLRRLESLSVLERGVQRLALAIDHTKPLPPGANAQEAWTAVTALFEESEGQNLRELIAEGIARASASVTREREATDRTLRWMRRLWAGTALALALAAMLMAWYFTRALHRPLTGLTLGAEALQRGELDYRIADTRDDEFARVAHSFNAMASELNLHRQRETTARAHLQSLVTERTTELQNALASMQELDVRRRKLFADISHELRTPTTAIRGEAEVALRGQQKAVGDYQSALQRILDVAKQLGLVIDDLLTMARTDIDALALDKQPMDPRDALLDALHQAAGLAAERGVQLRVKLPEVSLEVSGDGPRIRQLMLLLIDNAIRYSHPDGTVEVVMATGEDSMGASCVTLQVADQGIGITAQELHRIFERHFRSSAACSHYADGTGLGLAIAAVLAKAHCGSVSLDSQVGIGTTATLSLPLVRAAHDLGAML